MKVIAGKEIGEDLLGKVSRLEMEIFGPKLSVGEQIFRSLHSNDYGGLFCLVDDAGEPIAFADALFLSEEQKEIYLKDKDFKKLVNIGPRVGDDNILYLFGLALVTEYRSTGIIRNFAQIFAKWLDDFKDKGVRMKFTFAEAVSADGARFSRALGLIPVNESDIDEQGRGFYYSPDNMERFIKTFAGRK